MSLFKAKDLWSTKVGEGEAFDSGCLCVADIDNSQKEKIIVGSFSGFLRVYQPCFIDSSKVKDSPFTDEKSISNEAKNKQENKYEISNFSSSVSRLQDCFLYELKLSDSILQVEAGKFVNASNKLSLAVLQSKKISVYISNDISANKIMGNLSNWELTCEYEHKLQRNAYNFCFGSFGGVKGKDFLCIQSMDGTLSIFEQESFAFYCHLPLIILPGPIHYVHSTDSFIVSSSSRQIDSYKLDVLARLSGKVKDSLINSQSANKIVSDWTFIISENAKDIKSSLLVDKTCLFILGSRNLYVLSDIGKLIFMKKFEHDPSCFLPYSRDTDSSIKWMVISHSKTILTYNCVNLRWAAQFSFLPVQVKLISIGNIKGLIVTMDDEGHLQVCCLGSEPSVYTRQNYSSHSTLLENGEITKKLTDGEELSNSDRGFDFESAEKEIKQLQTFIKSRKDTNLGLSSLSSSSSTSLAGSSKDIKLAATVNENFDMPSIACDMEFEETLGIPSIGITLQIQSKVKINNLKIKIACPQPLVSSQDLFVIPSISPGEGQKVEFSVFMKIKMIPNECKVIIIANYYTNSDAPRIVQTSVKLPINIFCNICQPNKMADQKVTLNLNQLVISLSILYSDIFNATKEKDLYSNGLGFRYFGQTGIVSLLASKNTNKYRIQCDNITSLYLIIKDLIARMKSHYGKNLSITIEPNQIPFNNYFDTIDKHFNCKKEIEALDKILEERSIQFRSVQKRLLILFKDKTPTPLRNLDILIETSYRQIASLVVDIEKNSIRLSELSSELLCCSRLICLLFQLAYSLSKEDCILLEATLVIHIENGPNQIGWHEMVEYSITNLLKTTLSKNANKELNVPINMAIEFTSLKDTEKLKKYIVIFFDRLAKDSKHFNEYSDISRGDSLKPIEENYEPPLNQNPFNYENGDNYEKNYKIDETLKNDTNRKYVKKKDTNIIKPIVTSSLENIYDQINDLSII